MRAVSGAVQLATGAPRTLGTRRDYRVRCCSGRSRTPTRRRAARYGAPVMCGMAVTAGAQVCRIQDGSEASRRGISDAAVGPAVWRACTCAGRIVERTLCVGGGEHFAVVRCCLPQRSVSSVWWLRRAGDAAVALERHAPLDRRWVSARRGYRGRYVAALPVT